MNSISPLLVAVLTTLPCATALETRIAERVASPDREVRSHAYRDLETLLRGGCTDTAVLSAYLEAGAETDHVLRMHVSVLSELLPHGIASTLDAALSSSKSHVRIQALRGIAQLKESSDNRIHKVLALTHDTDTLVVETAAVALASIDVKGLSFPLLLAELRSDSTPRRLRAARTLDRFDRSTSTLIPDLIPLLDEPDETVRYWLLNVVANSKEVAPQAFRAVVRTLRADPSAFVRERAARELWELATTTGTTPSDAQETLLFALNTDADSGVRLQVARAMRAHRAPGKAFTAAFAACALRETGELGRVCGGAH